MVEWQRGVTKVEDALLLLLTHVARIPTVVG